MTDRIRYYEGQFSLPLSDKLKDLNEQIAYARKNSRFYSYLPEQPLSSLEELKRIPEISCEDLVAHAEEMTCTPPWRVKRMVTLSTSGSTAQPKRLAFSERDIQQTVDFFNHGMHTLCETQDAVGILMPGTNPDGLCDILSRGLRGFGAVPEVYGVIQDFEDAAVYLKEKKPAVLVGFPVQIRQLALTSPDYRPACVLLSADYCAQSVIETIERIWHCRAFVHYGITESGLGCAVETPSDQGMIPRKDVLLEVNERGEILLTTLKREALPLIRYNTGDLGVLREDGHLMRVLGRREEKEGRVSITTLDEILLKYDWILNYQAELAGEHLKLSLQGQRPAGQKPAGQRPAGQKLAGQRPAGQKPAGQKPAEQRPAEQNSEEQRFEELLNELAHALNTENQNPLTISLASVSEIPFTGKRLIQSGNSKVE